MRRIARPQNMRPHFGYRFRGILSISLEERIFGGLSAAARFFEIRLCLQSFEAQPACKRHNTRKQCCVDTPTPASSTQSPS
jgi:hypothetical protein